MRAICIRQDVSVIICAYTDQRWDELVAAVQSVQRQIVSPMEIIVVTDQNEQLLRRICAQITGVTAIRNEANPGLSGARNSGVAIAHGEIVAFLDDDAIATPTWIERLIAHYDDAKVIGVGGISKPLWRGNRPGWFPEEFYWVVGCTHRGTPRSTAQVRNLIGTNMSFRRRALTAVSGFSSEIGQIGAGMARCDDTEVCIRLQRLWPEHHLLHDVEATVMHHVPPSRARWKYFCVRCYTEGKTKARLSRLVGARDGLAAERTFILRTLPSGLLRDLLGIVIHRDLSGLARACAIIAGLSITMMGYLVGTIANYVSTLRPKRPRYFGV